VRVTSVFISTGLAEFAKTLFRSVPSICGAGVRRLASTGVNTPGTMLPSSSSALHLHVTLSSPARQRCFPSIASGLQIAMVSNSERAPGVAPGDRAQLDEEGPVRYKTPAPDSSAVVNRAGLARLGRPPASHAGGRGLSPVAPAEAGATMDRRRSSRSWQLPGCQRFRRALIISPFLV